MLSSGGGRGLLSTRTEGRPPRAGRFVTRSQLTGSDKTQRELEAHFQQFYRSKPGGKDERQHAQNGAGPGPDGAEPAAKHVRRRAAVALSLFAPYKELPPEGKTLGPEDEYCDPDKQSCQEPKHVWEAKCTACYGLGVVRGSSGGRRGRRPVATTCLLCHGIGYVRRTSLRYEPDDSHLTLNRPRPPDKQ